MLIFIHSLGSGGAERVAAHLANQWAREGWRVTLVTQASADTDHFQLDAGVHRMALGLAGDSHGVAAALANNLRRIVALRGVLREIRPSVAVAMMSSGSVLLALARVGLPVVAIGAERAQPSAARLGRIWAGLRRWAYGRLSAVVALTPESAAWILRHTRASRVAVIPNPVVWPLPVQSPRIDPASVGRADRYRLLSVGRLVPVKGMDTVLTAFGRLADRHPDWELAIVGTGAGDAVLRREIVRLGLGDRVALVGRAGNLADWYRSADLFVLASRHEGFPNALVEAMAHGLPCVSYDCEAGPRNIIRHGVDGVLVPDQDLDALVSALDSLMRDAGERARYAEQAQEIRARLAIPRISELWRELFEQVVT